ncbi:MAG: hypothetical protein FWD94_08795, partial [Treponema sp.]|nr:hypothetical protein [Treponema sp.]
MKNMTFTMFFLPAFALSFAGCPAVPKLEMPEGRVLIELDGGSPGHGAGIAGPAKSFVLGQTIAANTDALGGAGFTFQWRRGGDALPEVTGRTYTLRKEDVGYPITVIAFSGEYSGGVISDPTFPILTGDEKSSNSIANIAELDIDGTLWVGETLEVMLEWNAADEDMDAIVFQWMRSAPSEREPRSSDYLPIPGANGPEYVLTWAERGRWIKVVAVHPDHDWYVDGYFDDGKYGSGKIEPLAYGPVIDPGPVKVSGPNSVTREEARQYGAFVGETEIVPSEWNHDEKDTKHFNTYFEDGEFKAGYGERNRWNTIRAVSGGAQGFKKVLVRSNAPPGD